MREIISILVGTVLVLGMIAVAAPVVTQGSGGATVVNAPSGFGSSLSTCQYMLDFGSTYPGIREDFIPPVKACEAVNFTITLSATEGDAGHDNLYGVLELVSAPQTTSNVAVTIDTASTTLNLTDPDLIETHILEFAGPFALGPDESISWSATFRLMEPGLYELRFLAYYPGDDDPLPPVEPEVVGEKCIAIQSYQWMDAYPIDLYRKWNLISLPIVPFDTDTEAMLAAYPDTEELLSVWCYDRGAEAWQSYAPGAPSDLLTIEDGKAYWVRIYYDSLEFPGTYHGTLWVFGLAVPASPTPPSNYPVYEGWNMVGFRSLTEMLDSAYLWNFTPTVDYGTVFGWNAVSQMWNSMMPGAADLVPGEGYWIAFSEAGTIYPPTP